MRFYRDFSTRNAASVRTPVNPTAVTVRTSTTAGAVIENLIVAANDGAVGRYRVDTVDGLYTNGQTFRAAWTATIGAVTFTRTVYERHVTPAASGSIPDPPTVGDPAVGDTWATFPNVSPAGSTTIITVTGPGGTFTGSGSGATITVTGLTASSTYDWYAESLSAGGVYSLASAGNPMGSLHTQYSLTIARPLLFKYYVNNEPTQHEDSPREINIEGEEQGITVGDDRSALGRGPVFRFRLENNYGTDWGLMDITLRYVEPQQAPFGLGQRWRAR